MDQRINPSWPTFSLAGEASVCAIVPGGREVTAGKRPAWTLRRERRGLETPRMDTLQSLFPTAEELLALEPEALPDVA
jgi:hypothetical protein